jgi:hypothetical protein
MMIESKIFENVLGDDVNPGCGVVAPDLDV